MTTTTVPPRPVKFFAPNLWPEYPAGFRPVWEAYYREMERVATTLMRIFAVGLGMDKHYFDDKVDRHITNFSVLHYPEQPKAPLPGQLRAGAHTDYGSLTILKPDNAPGGLQVLNKDGAMDRRADAARYLRGQPRRPYGRVDQQSLGFYSAPRRQSAARQGVGQPPAVDGVLPSAEL